MLKDKDSVSLTTDIWSDRVMRSFLGVTAHTNILDITTGAEELRSFLLSCKRFSGSHTGTSIAAAFDDILEIYVINSKVEHILTDNASNMKSAFKVNFPTEDDDDDVDDDGDDAASGDQIATISLVVPTVFTSLQNEGDSVLDPQFAMHFVDLDVLVEGADAAALQSHTQKKKTGADNTALTAKNQFAKYLEEIDGYDPTEGRCDVFHFWPDNKKKFPHLSNLAIRVLSIPASSPPIERVFSRGGIIMRPHRARLGAETLSKLIFLKCNETLSD
ncbi:zinc finger BED domain-containing 4-like [Paramuricea clavata]|uniref:Zinc finger BED domain-containing 4-like n=1 Tax=Paramuricea clavata TaxID=317549 RepID=A0A6S7KFW2_PARCT|nr:zinc finger BED domain-containing 4-like [Paramuricea clavata]